MEGGIVSKHGKCERCGGFHFHGKRARRQRAKFMQRCIRRGVNQIRDAVDRDLINQFIQERPL